MRVVDGRIIERFDELVNPGRSIIPRIAKLTGITDTIVKDKPDIEEIMKKFSAFANGQILLGHNIKSSDLYYIERAAKRTGVTMQNEFFDTFRYAKERESFDKVRYKWFDGKLILLAITSVKI